jgi:cytochrome P450
MREMQADRLGLYQKLAAEGRQASLIHFGPVRMYVFNQPEMAQAILVDHAADFDKGLVLHRALEPVIGDGLFIAEGDAHRKQRKLIAPAFTYRHIAAYADTMVQYAEAAQAGWRNGAEVRIDREMTALTMRIIGKTLFDAEVLEESDELGAAITTALQFMDYTISHIFPLPLGIPTPGNRRTRAALDLVKGRLQAMIDERRNNPTERNDFLSILLRARDETGAGMDDTQVREEAMTLFLAGHETVANTLSWCAYFLATHPAVADRLQAEVDQALGGRTPTAADLPNLPYALQVFKEALRIYPPADGVTRTALHDVTVGPYRFKKNEIMAIPIYTIHRRPDFFPDPERFDPDRFTPEAEKRLPRYAFMPFGAGPRVCIGNHFAMMEGQLILAVLAQHTRFDLVPGQEVVPFPVFAVRQKHGCRVVVRRRGACKV